MNEEKVEQESGGLPQEIQTKMDEELKKLLGATGTWVMVKTKDGDILTGRTHPAMCKLADAILLGNTDDVLGLQCVVRYVEMNVPVQGPKGLLAHSIMAVRPDLEADDNPTFIPYSNVSRWKLANPERSAAEFVRLQHTEELQTHMRTKLQKDQEEMERRMSHAGLALPGDPRGIPPHVAAALRRQMAGG